MTYLQSPVLRLRYIPPHVAVHKRQPVELRKLQRVCNPVAFCHQEGTALWGYKTLSARLKQPLAGRKPGLVWAVQEAQESGRSEGLPGRIPAGPGSLTNRIEKATFLPSYHFASGSKLQERDESGPLLL